jgi:hypothetical protein
MERYTDIIELLEEVKHNISSLHESYDQAKQDEALKEVLKPLVKSSLEHLRSVLEYSAQDVWDSYNNKSKKLYFPYGKDEALFKKNLKRNLPGLQDKKLYALIESLQPHKCGENWLIDLCKQTNFNKHNKLRKQVRENSDKSTIDIGNLVRMDRGSTVKFSNCIYNGMPLGVGKPAVVSGDMSVKQIQENIGIPVLVTKMFEWVEFRFENSTVDTLYLIERAYTEISKYVKNLKEHIG